jgi:uncharacterized protein (TIGR03435 family)
MAFRMRRRVAAILWCCCFLSARIPAQPGRLGASTNAPRFEVASVKVNRTGHAGEAISRTSMRPDGSVSTVNTAVSQLLEISYGYPNDQIVGLPKWTNDARFDVTAKATTAPSDAGSLSPESITARLRSLLEDRFKLTAHTETRQGPVYELHLARADGRLGSGLTRADRDDCAAMLAGRAAPAPPAVLRTQPACGSSIGLGSLSAGGMQIEQLAQGPLSRLLQRPVIDQTNLQGTFDVQLRFPFGETPAGLPFVAPGDSAPVDPNRASIFTTIQEQLGLKLVAARGPVAVLVVDRIEMPAPD